MLSIIPAPLHVISGPGQFAFQSGTVIEASNPMLTPLVNRFCRDLARRTGLRARPMHGPGGRCCRVELTHGAEFDAIPPPAGISPLGDFTPDERYSLKVDGEGILIRAVEPAGIERGLTTLLQLLATTPPGESGAVVLQTARIIDAPRFAWRGLTLDVAGRLFTVDELKRVVDLLSLYKFNALHLHLTDDQGWRIEAGRPAHRRLPDGTFYTNAELRELIAYAQERFVTMVPEVDTPGHAAALVALHPELSTSRNVDRGDNVWLDPESPATFAVIESALDELTELFDSPFVHIGGEQPLGMPDELYVTYVKHLHEFLRSIGKKTVGSQETVRAITDSDHIIQYWSRGEDVREALKKSVPVIVSLVDHAYFDVPYAESSADPAQEDWRRRIGLQIHHPRSVAETFEWEPVSAVGEGARSKNLAGVCAAIWSETIDNFDELTFMLLPRLAGAAAKAWSDPRTASWAVHRERLAAHGKLWAQDDLTYFHSSLVDWSGKRGPTEVRQGLA
jgi:hexosaminidase